MIFSLKNCVKYTKVSHSEYLFIFSKLNIKSKTLIYHNLINSSTNNWPNLQSVKTRRFRSRCFNCDCNTCTRILVLVRHTVPVRRTYSKPYEYTVPPDM